MLLFNAMGICKELAAVCYFNTSHVIIQPHFMVLVTVAESNFNTSYVIIQPLNAFQKLNRCCLFQYILCYYSTNEKPSFLHLTDLYKSRS